VIKKICYVDYVCAGAASPDYLDDPEVNLIRVESGESKLSRLKILKTILHQIVDKAPDIVIMHDFERIYIIPFIRVYAPKTKIILDSHEAYLGQLFMSRKINFAYKFLLGILFMFSEMGLLPLCDFIFTADRYTKYRYNKLKKGKTEALYNFPDISRLPPQTRETADEPIKIIYSGGLFYERGLKEMIEIASKCKNMELYLAGRTFTAHEERYLQDSLAKYTNIIYMNYLPYQELLKKLAECDIGIGMLKLNRKFKHNIMVKQFDYMCAGLPVIARRGLVSFVKDGYNGFNADNAEEVLRILESTPRRDWKVMGENGRKLVEKYFNWEREASKLKRIIESV